MELALQTDDSKFFSPSSSRICFGWHPTQEIQLMSPAQSSIAVTHCSRQKQTRKAGRQLSNLGTAEAVYVELLPETAQHKLASERPLHLQLLLCHLPDSQLLLFSEQYQGSVWWVTEQINQ